MNRIYIVGYMCAGKSTVASRLAHKIGFGSFDTDRLFEEKYKLSVHDFFHKYGENLFRKLETEILKSTASLENAVISTGGGTPCFNDNMDWMKANGTTVFVKISPQTAVDRILHSRQKRPLAENKSPEELHEYVQEHYARRLPYYEQARFVVKGENVDMDALARLIERE